MCEGVRYDHIRRVDIGRIIILYSCGGMYVDMDVLPNRDVYMQEDLAVCRIGKNTYNRNKVKRKSLRAANGKPQTKSRLTAKKSSTIHKKTRGSTPNDEKKDVCYDMKAIIAKAGNPVLVNWLEHMQHELDTRRYKKPGSHWRTAKMRYVMHTTGPYGVNMFVRLPAQKKAMDNLKVHCVQRAKIRN